MTAPTWDGGAAEDVDFYNDEEPMEAAPVAASLAFDWSRTGIPEVDGHRFCGDPEADILVELHGEGWRVLRDRHGAVGALSFTIEVGSEIFERLEADGVKVCLRF